MCYCNAQSTSDRLLHNSDCEILVLENDKDISFQFLSTRESSRPVLLRNSVFWPSIDEMIEMFGNATVQVLLICGMN